MFLTRRHEFWRVFIVAGIGFVLALFSVFWPFLRSAYFEQWRPYLRMIDATALGAISLSWAVSVFAWFWVKEETWLMRSIFVCLVLVVWFVIALALGLTVGWWYSAVTGI